MLMGSTLSWDGKKKVNDEMIDLNQMEAEAGSAVSEKRGAGNVVPPVVVALYKFQFFVSFCFVFSSLDCLLLDL